MKKKRKHFELILSKSMINSLVTLVLIFSLFTGCKKDTEPTQFRADAQSQAPDQLMAKWGAPNIVVHKGQSIQAAIDTAKKGSTIFIDPGIYKEALLINKPGIKLIGKLSLNSDEIVIKNPGEENNGVTVRGNGDGFILANVTVKGFERNGVFLDSADNYIISNVKAIDNDEYGIFPVHSNHGLIEFCIATGSSDTGIYVGQSSDVKMQFNTAFANVNGLEIENSSNVDASFNQSYHNVAGMLIDLLPGKDIEISSNIHVHSNHVYDNNHPNFGDSGELESQVPPGLGILVLGTDQTVIEGNIITGNDFAGITVFSSLVLVVLAGIPPGEFDFEPNPDGAKISKNFLAKNGSNPPNIPGLPLPGVDLLYDGSGTNNCWSKNTFATSYPSPLPSCN